MTLVRMNKGYSNHMNHYSNMNSWMDSWMKGLELDSSMENRPKANIIELDKSFTIEMAIPGIAKEDIVLKVEDSVLTVSHEEPKEEVKTDKRFIRQEYKVGGFTRSFRLSRWVSHEDISASFNNGILSIEIPKKDEAISKPAREIKIS